LEVHVPRPKRIATSADLPGDPRLPLYERLRESFLAKIRSGEWGPGAALPAELTLAAIHNVALGTVRRAIDALVDDGLLERRQGSGTFVRGSGEFSSSMFRFFRLQAEDGAPLLPEGRLLTRKVEPVPEEARTALGLRAGAAVIRMSRLRLVGSEPLLAEDIVLPLDPFRAFLDIPAAEIGPLLYPVYASVCRQVIARAEETLTFRMCPAPQARLLRRRPGSPVVVIERVAYGLDDLPKEWRRSYGPAERFHYRVEIR
jgi:GntR family transcriptional regulator